MAIFFKFSVLFWLGYSLKKGVKIFYRMRLFHHFRLFCVLFVLKSVIFNTKKSQGALNDDIAVLTGFC